MANKYELLADDKKIVDANAYAYGNTWMHGDANVYGNAVLTREEYEHAMEDMADALGLNKPLSDTDMMNMHVEYVTSELTTKEDEPLKWLNKDDWEDVARAYNEAKLLGESTLSEFKGVLAQHVLDEYDLIIEDGMQERNYLESNRVSIDQLDVMREGKGLNGDEADIPYYESKLLYYGQSVDSLMVELDDRIRESDERISEAIQELRDKVASIDDDIVQVMDVYIETGKVDFDFNEPVSEKKSISGIDFSKGIQDVEPDKTVVKNVEAKPKAVAKQSVAKPSNTKGRKVSSNLEEIYEAAKNAGIDGPDYD